MEAVSRTPWRQPQFLPKRTALAVSGVSVYVRIIPFCREGSSASSNLLDPERYPAVVSDYQKKVRFKYLPVGCPEDKIPHRNLNEDAE